ncbi:MAG: outer membrane beta-barrel protein [Acidobacteria bacterium]|nr:outer membrane beta-barrel protein [Acidobacteriota bacterium]
MHRQSVLVIGGLSWILAAATTQAQTPPSQTSATIVGTGGVTAGMHGTGPLLGGSVTYDLNDWFAVEGSGTYFNRGAGADAVSAHAGLLVNILPSSRKTVPYVAIGGGVYHASFDLDHRRFLGGMSPQSAPGTQFVPVRGMGGFGMMAGGYSGPAVWEGPWTGATFASPNMPAFYANRMGVMTAPEGGRWGMRSFTDPALVIGGGVRLGLTPHLSVRPEFRAVSVFGAGRMNTLGAFSLNLGYRF